MGLVYTFLNTLAAWAEDGLLIRRSYVEDGWHLRKLRAGRRWGALSRRQHKQQEIAKLGHLGGTDDRMCWCIYMWEMRQLGFWFEQMGGKVGHLLRCKKMDKKKWLCVWRMMTMIGASGDKKLSVRRVQTAHEASSQRRPVDSWIQIWSPGRWSRLVTKIQQPSRQGTKR